MGGGGGGGGQWGGGWGSRGDWGLGLEMWGVKLFYTLRKCKMMATGG